MRGASICLIPTVACKIFFSRHWSRKGGQINSSGVFSSGNSWRAHVRIWLVRDKVTGRELE